MQILSTDGDPSPLGDRGKKAPLVPKGDLLSWRETSPSFPTHATTASQDLFLKQSSFILIKSRCSFKVTVATKMLRELPPAKSRAPNLAKDFTKAKKPNPNNLTWLKTKFLFKS